MVIGQPVAFLDMTSEAPAAWVASEPGSGIRLLQFTVPTTNAAVAAELAVYYFGPDHGVSLEANVAALSIQSRRRSRGTRHHAVDRQMTLVELTGSYARGVGVGPVGDALPNRTLLGGVIEES